MKALDAILLALLFAGFAAASSADGLEPDVSCAAGVARKVQAHYETVTDLSARFVQTREAVIFGGGTAAPEPARQGTVVLSKPGRMRWSYETPEPSLMITDGEVVWMYDPLLEEAQRLSDAGGLLSGAAVQFLMGQGDLLASFTVSARDCAARPVRLDLVPKQDASYERLALAVDPETGRVHSSAVTDLFGNRTTVTFEDVRVNVHPDAGLFRFTPPPGVSVIDLTTEPGPQGGVTEGP